MINESWLTPPEFVERLEAFNRGRPVALDPCAAAGQFVRARVRIYKPRRLDDRGGLDADWCKIRGGLVFVNPPWHSARDLHAWAFKIWGEVEAARVGRISRCEVVALLPGNTDTNWYQALFPYSDAVLAWKGRLCFRRRGDSSANPARFPSHVFYFGSRISDFHRVFSDRGIWLRGYGVAYPDKRIFGAVVNGSGP